MGLCARAGACEIGLRRHPPSRKSPNAILELSDAKFKIRKDFVGYFDDVPVLVSRQSRERNRKMKFHFSDSAQLNKKYF